MDVGELKKRAQEITDQLLDVVETMDKCVDGAEASTAREQLRVVGKSIDRLESSGVTVPDDLRRVKVNLLAQLEAIDDLLRVRVDLAQRLCTRLGAIPPAKATAGAAARLRRSRRRNLNTTSQTKYKPHIVEILRERGGSAPTSEIRAELETRFREKFTPDDLAETSPGYAVWWNRANWARMDLINEGILKSNSPRGVWELAENVEGGSPHS